MTIPDDLEAKLAAFAASQPAAPSLAGVLQVALRRFLADPDRSGPASSLIQRVLANREQIKSAAVRHGGSNVRLFGSIARGEDVADGDVDLLISLEADRTFFDLARLRADLEALLEASVDLVTDSGLSGSARAEVLAEAISL